jgi:FtsH-binding integral membrane protein
MSDFNGRYTGAIPAQADMSVDAGLRAFMLGVYNKLCLGLLLAAGLAYVASHVPEASALFFVTSGERLVALTPLGTIVQWSPLAIILLSSFTMRNPTSAMASLVYWAVVACFGLSMGVLFYIYNAGSIGSTLAITAASFGALSLYGYTTKKDLTGLGTFLIMGLFGLIIVMLVNAFLLHSSAMDLIISAVGVLIFAGLTAYDTQKTKMIYYAAGGDTARLAPATSFAALNLFLDFVNMFLFLLRLMGGRR